IDAEIDLIFNRIVARTLTDLYSDIGTAPYSNTTDFTHYAPQNGMDMGEADKFWAPSYTEALNLLCNGTWATNSADWNTANSDAYYWLRSPYADYPYGACFVSSGLCVDVYVSDDYYAARACFKLA
ncbi:MAG: hypothetical protein IJA69_00960, partial [Clostridia bacterium]|nr:hypothetical protein [Clostridia bacterium]